MFFVGGLSDTAAEESIWADPPQIKFVIPDPQKMFQQFLQLRISSNHCCCPRLASTQQRTFLNFTDIQK